jgi:SAM-dependent methyltransferase
MLREVQRQALPELTRVFGPAGLYLRPTGALGPDLSGHQLGTVASLHRAGSGFQGDLVCTDEAVPIASGTLALVYGLFIIETSPDPAALLGEVSRMLQPDGVALLVTLNPWSPCRMRWAFRGLRPVEPSAFAAHVGAAGLDVLRRGYLGPMLATAGPTDLEPQRGAAMVSRLRAASLVVARRRDPGVTLLRTAAPALKFRPGMSAG